ncbi:MAG: phosphoribosylglycinamide formyltransferase [Parvularculaceae bacterium]|nr:phosphoribosylglycinamide formyltransferase [Parvularculaceae bacterium]
MARARTAVLISGRGSNMQALIEASKAGGYPAEIVLVVSNIPDAEGLVRAAAAGVKTAAIDHRTFGKGAAGKRHFEAALQRALQEAEIELLCLAGFMRLLSPDFTNAWRGRLLNIHPSLLPAFKGLDVHAAMLNAGVKIAGCTVHYVSAEMDAGPIIGQAATPVLPGDTPETLAARILKEEHRLYPECLRLVAEGLAPIGADGVVQPLPGASGALLNPPSR